MMNTGFSKSTRVTNFGGNLSFDVEHYVLPASAEEAREFLNGSQQGSVRATGARHSWSEAVTTHDAMVDLARLKEMKIEVRDGHTLVSAGAGCSVDEILRFLSRQNPPLSLPAFGIIGKQSIAGAVSTATHGSGRESMSNLVVAVRFAAFDHADRTAQIFELDEIRDNLEAVRCAVGCMGVLLELKLRCEKRGMVSEEVRKADSLKEVLDWEADYPLQQFYLLPLVWKWHAQLRRKTTSSRSSRLARMWYYSMRFLKIELFFNLSVKVLANVPLLRSLLPRFFNSMYRRLKESGKEFVDYSDRLLMMKDDLFRHTEMELFIMPDRLDQAVRFIEGVLRYCAGEIPANFGSISQIVACHGDPKVFAGLKDSYKHHYPITFRKVLKDDTMISMTNDGDRYAVSFITYRNNIDSFEAVMSFLASVMANAFEARPHWGKLLPLDSEAIAHLYPRLPDFRDACEHYDPQGVFRNRFATNKLWPRPAL